MKNHSIRTLVGAAFAVCAMAAMSISPALAAPPRHAETVFLQGVADATSTTFATTSYADLTGATVTVDPVRDAATTDAASGVRTKYLRVSVTLNMSKATGTSGTCGIYVNGAILAKTEKTIAFLASTNQNVTAVFLLTNSTSSSQTVKVQCKSADTSVLTVSAGHLIVEELTS